MTGHNEVKEEQNNDEEQFLCMEFPDLFTFHIFRNSIRKINLKFLYSLVEKNLLNKMAVVRSQNKILIVLKFTKIWFARIKKRYLASIKMTLTKADDRGSIEIDMADIMRIVSWCDLLSWIADYFLNFFYSFIAASARSLFQKMLVYEMPHITHQTEIIIII